MISVATGIDLVEVKRFQNLDPRIKDRFFHRVFTSQELEEPNQSLQHLAGKFAAKEAAAKALGCGIGRVGWQDLEIINDSCGKPELILHTHAAQAAADAGWTSWAISITHTHTHAMASVTALIEKNAG